MPCITFPWWNANSPPRLFARSLKSLPQGPSPSPRCLGTVIQCHPRTSLHHDPKSGPPLYELCLPQLYSCFGETHVPVLSWERAYGRQTSSCTSKNLSNLTGNLAGDRILSWKSSTLKAFQKLTPFWLPMLAFRFFPLKVYLRCFETWHHSFSATKLNTK